MSVTYLAGTCCCVPPAFCDICGDDPMPSVMQMTLYHFGTFGPLPGFNSADCLDGATLDITYGFHTTYGSHGINFEPDDLFWYGRGEVPGCTFDGRQIFWEAGYNCAEGFAFIWAEDANGTQYETFNGQGSENFDHCGCFHAWFHTGVIGNIVLPGDEWGYSVHGINWTSLLQAHVGGAPSADCGLGGVIPTGTGTGTGSFDGSVSFTVSGVSNGSCTDCGNVNGTFTLTWQNRYFWESDPLTLCGSAGAAWRLSWNGGGWYLTLSDGDSGGGTTYATYGPGALANIDWDGTTSMTLARIGGEAQCSSWPASITINP